MPLPELKEWVALVKDILLGVAALVTTILAIYSVRLWKRELAGKEIYAAARALVKESHHLTKACHKARMPVLDSERRVFTAEEINETTENERWRISEREVYQKRLEDFRLSVDSYNAALLDVRVLVGSKAYLGFFPFGKLITTVVHRVNDYLDVVTDYSRIVFPDTEEVCKAKLALYPSHNPNDELTEQLGDARESGEKSLLAYLDRKSIRG